MKCRENAKQNLAKAEGTRYAAGERCAAAVISRILDGFDEKAHRPETVVAGDHGGSRIFHPAVIEIFPAMGEGHHKGRHAFPRAVAEPFRLLPAVGDEDLPLAEITGVLDRIFILSHQVLVTRHAHDGDLDLLHFSASPLRLRVRSCPSACRSHRSRCCRPRRCTRSTTP